MKATKFTDQQHQAMMDLLVLGMYSDGHLASIEESRIQSLLATIEFSSDYARQQFADASFSRVRRQCETPDSTRSYLAELAGSFPTPDIRRRACARLEDLLSSDNQVTDPERRFLAMVREVFQA